MAACRKSPRPGRAAIAPPRKFPAPIPTREPPTPPRGMYILELPPNPPLRKLPPPPRKPPPPPSPPPPMRAPPPPRPPPRWASATSGIRRVPAARMLRAKRVLCTESSLSAARHAPQADCHQETPLWPRLDAVLDRLGQTLGILSRYASATRGQRRPHWLIGKTVKAMSRPVKHHVPAGLGCVHGALTIPNAL